MKFSFGSVALDDGADHFADVKGALVQQYPALLSVRQQDRVIDNIVANAVKYSDQPIHVYVLDMPSFVRVSVVDRGIGISQDELPHIFEEFWRSERASWKRGGSGVGLFIVKTIMEAHGGRIEVESRAEKGTTVSLIFPRALSAFPSQSQPQAVAQTQNSSVANSPT